MPQDRTAILQIVPSLDTGGAERTTIDVAAALSQSGYQPLVATRGGRMLGELARAGGEWISMDVGSKMPHALALNVYRLSRLIRIRNIALVHARSRAPAWSAFYAARRSGVPFVTTYHGIYNARGGLKRFYNSVMARADVVIANSRWTAEHIAAEYDFRPKRLVVIPRGIDFTRFDPAKVSPETIADMRARWGAGRDELVVLLPGRLTRWKGQTVLLDAFARLKTQGALGRLKAVLVGDAQGRHGFEAELRKQIGDSDLESRVVIAGHEPDMPTAYLAADLVVSASTDPEAFGRVSAEAGAMGRVVVATDHGGAREIVLPGRSGLLVTPGDAAALAAGLKDISAMDEDRRLEMGRAARAHIAAEFTVERMCADTLAVYREILRR